MKCNCMILEIEIDWPVILLYTGDKTKDRYLTHLTWERKKMDDAKLLNFYLDMYGAEAAPWNLSPVNLYLEMETRDWFIKEVALPVDCSVCNIGIGAGDWDEFLGYKLLGKGRLTSVDIDSETCDTFAYRQKREGHPNPSIVICQDILEPFPTNQLFDLVCITGSTLRETGAYEPVLDNLQKLLKPGGLLFYMDVERYHGQAKLSDYLNRQGKLHLIKSELFTRFPNMMFHVNLLKTAMV